MPPSNCIICSNRLYAVCVCELLYYEHFHSHRKKALNLLVVCNTRHTVRICCFFVFKKKKEEENTGKRSSAYSRDGMKGEEPAHAPNYKTTQSRTISPQRLPCCCLLQRVEIALSQSLGLGVTACIRTIFLCRLKLKYLLFFFSFFEGNLFSLVSFQFLNPHSHPAYSYIIR